MFENLKADLSHFTSLPGGGRLLDLLLTQGAWAVAVYRFGHWVHTAAPRVVAVPCKVPYLVAQKVIEMTTGISIAARTTIGPGLYIGHFGGIIVHADAVLGANCSLSPGVVIGTRGGGRAGVARIGDNVYLANGAKILGPVTIGDEARIGANAVVLSDVPRGATAVGVPARVRPRVEPLAAAIAEPSTLALRDEADGREDHQRLAAEVQQGRGVAGHHAAHRGEQAAVAVVGGDGAAQVEGDLQERGDHRPWGVPVSVRRFASRR